MSKINELSAWIPYSIYVKGFPLSHCGWNGAYYKRYDEVTKSDYWELGETSMLCGLITIRRTIIRKMEGEWIMETKDDRSLLIRGLRNEERGLRKVGGPVITPFGEWQDDVHVDREYLPPHEYCMFCTIWCVIFAFFCGISLFIIYQSFKAGIVKFNY